MDLKLDPKTHDLSLENQGLSLTQNLEEVRQSLSIKLRLFLGEWFLDTKSGIPYFESIFIDTPKIKQIENIFKEAILTNPSILELESFSLEVNIQTRQLIIQFKAKTVQGNIEHVEVL